MTGPLDIPGFQYDPYVPALQLQHSTVDDALIINEDESIEFEVVLFDNLQTQFPGQFIWIFGNDDIGGPTSPQNGDLINTGPIWNPLITDETWSSNSQYQLFQDFMGFPSSTVIYNPDTNWLVGCLPLQMRRWRFKLM